MRQTEKTLTTLRTKPISEIQLLRSQPKRIPLKMEGASCTEKNSALKIEDSAKKQAKKSAKSKFPREVFIATEAIHARPLHTEPSSTKECTLKLSSNASGMKKIPSVAQMGLSFFSKFEQADLLKTLAINPTQESNTERPRDQKTFSARRIARCEGVLLPSINPAGKEISCSDPRSAQRTPVILESAAKLVVGKDLSETNKFGSTRFIPSDEFRQKIQQLPGSNGKNLARHNSNQISNLELASQCKIKIGPPRVTVNLEPAIGSTRVHSTPILKVASPFTGFPSTGDSKTSVKQPINRGVVRLKPIQRNAYSSQGTTIKVLLPKEFVESKTRPSSKEDENLKKTARLIIASHEAAQQSIQSRAMNSTRKLPKLPETPRIGPEEPKMNAGLEMINRLVETKGTCVTDTPTHSGQDGLYNVTFGEKQFQSIRTLIK